MVTLVTYSLRLAASSVLFSHLPFLSLFRTVHVLHYDGTVPYKTLSVSFSLSREKDRRKPNQMRVKQ